MVTGNGMIAHAFMDLANDAHVHVFASGVSRSTERDPREFAREHQLITAQPRSTARFIYFSSCSIYDPTLKNAPYVLHKLQMEALVRELHQDHLIIRLPNLVGRTSNPFTLTNFLRDRIRSGVPFDMHTKACRYLLDVEVVSNDLRRLFTLQSLKGTSIDVCGNMAFPIPVLVRTMERVLGKVTLLNEVDSGSCYTVDNTRFLDLLTADRRAAYEHIDLHELLNKYYNPAQA
jgi:nucleoside-diphosphate-sugar epimerase